MLLVGRRVRARRGVPWGAPRWPFEIAPVYSQGAQVGWGATCKRHVDASDVPRKSPCCKKQLTFGAEGLSDQECISRLKLWLLAGFDVDVDTEGARSDHVRVNAREMDEVSTEAELDACLALH